jgi:HNH endonuclease
MQPRRLPQPASGIIFQIDHIIARHHKGRTATTNLALACVY